jgi:translation initiation factor 1
MITGLPDDGELTAALAQAFKRLCGSGGTVKPGGQIEIQGDHRDKLEAKLIELGHRVKRVGG